MNPESEFQIREGLDGLTPSRIVTLFRRAPLVRSAQSHDRIWAMFEASQLVLTAWRGTELAGIARVLTDGVEFSYLCDLAVEPDVQGLGIGRKLVDAIFERCEGTNLLVRDNGTASALYEKAGLRRVGDAWERPARV